MMKKQICSIRKINKAIEEYALAFEIHHSLSLNEAMLLCTLREGCQAAGCLAEGIGMSSSNTSKVIRSVEEKGFVTRRMGNADKRQMFFDLTAHGSQKLDEIETSDLYTSPLLERILKCIE